MGFNMRPAQLGPWRQTALRFCVGRSAMSQRAMSVIDANVSGSANHPKKAENAESRSIVYTYPRIERGYLIKRYKRFLADVELDVVAPEGDAPCDGEERPQKRARREMTVYCPNTGPMVGLLERPEAPIRMSVSDNPKRKYSHTLEQIQPEPDGAWVGIHSTSANAMVRSLLDRRLLPELGSYDLVMNEVAYGQGCRADFLLSGPQRQQTYVEVKSVTLAQRYAPPDGETATEGEPAQIALFPDTVSKRAQKHVRELMEVCRKGKQAACVFVIQRDDCKFFAPSYDHDPTYAALVSEAAAAGVLVSAVCVRFDGTDVVLAGRPQIILDYKRGTHGDAENA